MNYYEHHLGDYAKDTAHLSMLEHGAYRLLLDVYYTRECALPADTAACHKLARAQTKQDRQAVDYVLHNFFTLRDGAHHHNRCNAEILRYQDKQLKAKRSAQARWHGMVAGHDAGVEQSAGAGESMQAEPHTIVNTSMRSHHDRMLGASTMQPPTHVHAVMPTHTDRTAHAMLSKHQTPDTSHQTPLSVSNETLAHAPLTPEPKNAQSHDQVQNQLHAQAQSQSQAQTANQTPPHTTALPASASTPAASTTFAPVTSAPLTSAHEACTAMRAAGLNVPNHNAANTHHPVLQALLQDGATLAEFASAAALAVDKGKGFAYALAVVKGRREDLRKEAHHSEASGNAQATAPDTTPGTTPGTTPTGRKPRASNHTPSHTPSHKLSRTVQGTHHDQHAVEEPV